CSTFAPYLNMEHNDDHHDEPMNLDNFLVLIPDRVRRLIFGAMDIAELESNPMHLTPPPTPNEGYELPERAIHLKQLKAILTKHNIVMLQYKQEILYDFAQAKKNYYHERGHLRHPGVHPDVVKLRDEYIKR